MDVKQNNSKCAHVPCNCEAAAGSDYCSIRCKEALVETDCSCGHPECGAEAARANRE